MIWSECSARHAWSVGRREWNLAAVEGCECYLRGVGTCMLICTAGCTRWGRQRARSPFANRGLCDDEVRQKRGEHASTLVPPRTRPSGGGRASASVGIVPHGVIGRDRAFCGFFRATTVSDEVVVCSDGTRRGDGELVLAIAVVHAEVARPHVFTKVDTPTPPTCSPRSSAHPEPRLASRTRGLQRGRRKQRSAVGG